MPCGLTITDFEDVTQAQAQAFWACQWRDHMDTRKTEDNAARNAIAVLQQAASLYFADKQYDIQNRNLQRLNLITTEQLDHSKKLRLQWERGIDCESAQTDQACDILVPAPDYTRTFSRVRAQNAPAFNLRRKTAKRRYGVHCRAALCAELSAIDLEETLITTGMTEAAYRKEESIYKMEVAGKIAHRMNVLQHNRGMGVASGSLLASAAQVTQLASSINPYYGYTQAVNQMAGYWTGRTYDGMGGGAGGGAFSSMGLRPGGGQIGQAPFSGMLTAPSNGLTDAAVLENSQSLGGWNDSTPALQGMGVSGNTGFENNGSPLNLNTTDIMPDLPNTGGFA